MTGVEARWTVPTTVGLHVSIWRSVNNLWYSNCIYCSYSHPSLWWWSWCSPRALPQTQWTSSSSSTTVRTRQRSASWLKPLTAAAHDKTWPEHNYLVIIIIILLLILYIPLWNDIIIFITISITLPTQILLPTQIGTSCNYIIEYSAIGLGFIKLVNTFCHDASEGNGTHRIATTSHNNTCLTVNE